MDYLAAGLSLDKQAPFLYNTIDRLSGCLERVMAAKVADWASLTQMYSSRFHVEQKNE